MQELTHSVDGIDRLTDKRALAMFGVGAAAGVVGAVAGAAPYVGGF
jgi:hypothetical protein